MEAQGAERGAALAREGELRLGPLRPAGRWVSAPARARPDFLVIGAQKSGTTSLHRYLIEHPCIRWANTKEVHFFNNAYTLGVSWYLAQFPWRWETRAAGRRRGERTAVGEATPEYLFHPRVPARVHAFGPGMRLIAVLRDPVDRAYSQYQMQVRKRGETRTFEELLDLEQVELPQELNRIDADPAYVSPIGLRRSYVSRGRYAEQFERWLPLFPREQFLILTSEELSADPPSTVGRVTDFLGLPPWKTGEHRRWSAGSYEPMAAETRESLARAFEPHNRRLEELLGRTFDWTRPSIPAAS